MRGSNRSDLSAEVGWITDGNSAIETLKLPATQSTTMLCDHSDTLVEHAETTDNTPLGVEAKLCRDCGRIIDVF